MSKPLVITLAVFATSLFASAASGYLSGYESGRSQGHASGYNSGYDSGKADGRSSLLLGMVQDEDLCPAGEVPVSKAVSQSLELSYGCAKPLGNQVVAVKTGEPTFVPGMSLSIPEDLVCQDGSQGYLSISLKVAGEAGQSTFARVCERRTKLDGSSVDGVQLWVKAPGGDKPRLARPSEFVVTGKK